MREVWRGEARMASRETADVLVVGAGVFGLSVARACRAAGLSVLVADRDGPGAGASGGPVGALTPHMPRPMTPFKALQRDALLSLEGHVRALEAETGLPTGHARVGRVMPAGSEALRAEAPALAGAARAAWGGAGLEWRATPPPGTLAPEGCPHGVFIDDVSARIDPPAYVAALAASVGAQALRPGWTLTGLAAGRAQFDRGGVSAGHVVLAAGWESFALAGVGGGGVKGQAALLEATLPPDMPVVQGRGLFVTAHGPGRVGVGSTHERDWSAPGPDAGLDALLARAAALVPALAGARVLRRWAGLRPRAASGQPLVGPVPGRPGLILATGGYRIGLALAHEVARAVVAGIAGTPGPELPDSFAPGVRE
jgi:glycine/D-amino acid oxidase-like deaminating enzyme